ncbi:ABC transporter ATP-binding protein [Cupriavidus sp. BIS7]|uniref:ABC transporter ATP-binding protein n=1 Tax=Cupriavidus sp. BIS7 TaxID=1217718 RepID=UPI0006865E6A|nr:ABC transporter ATP-binding protein [Cupriavidus sp. BIS7]
MIGLFFRSGYRLAPRRDPRVAIGLLLSVLEGFLVALPIPLIYKLLSDVIHDTSSLHTISFIGAAFVMIALARIFVGAKAMQATFAGTYAMMAAARLRLANHLLRLPLGWFHDSREGDLGARLNADMETVEHIWSHCLGMFASSVAAIGFMLSFLAWIDMRLAAAAMLVLPLSLLALWHGQRTVARAGARALDSAAEMQAELHGYLATLRVHRYNGRFGYGWHRLTQALDKQLQHALALELRPAAWIAAFGATTEGCFVLITLLAVWWVTAGDLPGATLLLFAVLSLPMYRQLYDIGVAATLLRFGQHAMNRIEALLMVPPLPEPATPVQPGRFDIVADHIDFIHAGANADGMDEVPKALNDVSCRIPEGSLTAIVGANGAGKTTLLHLLARFQDVDSGAIRIGGSDVRQIGSANFHKVVSVVLQDVVLFPGTILDNLRLGAPHATREHVMAAARLAQAHAFIEKLPMGYDTELGDQGVALSGGERQRVSLARALLTDAPILLLDEPTASVDPVTDAAVARSLATLRDRTVVMVGHRLHSLCHADQILVLHDGRLVEQGTHDDLLAAGGRYARLWQRQQAPESCPAPCPASPPATHDSSTSTQLQP